VTDVLGGYCVGLAILYTFIYSIKSIDTFCKKQGPGFCISLAILICFLYAFLVPSASGYRLMGAFLGFSAGAYASIRFHLNPIKSRTVPNRSLSAFITVLIVYILYFLTSYARGIPPAIQSFIIAIWISLGAFPFCRAWLKAVKK
jgi:hypothetical protein